MDVTVTNALGEGKLEEAETNPLKASYGKLMMWFFIVSNGLYFSGFATRSL